MRNVDLHRAYLETTYWIDALPHPIALRIGAPNAVLDRLLARRRERRWAFVTAWNPGSVPTSSWANARHQRQLTRWLCERRLRWLPGVGEGDRSAWPPEPSMFVLAMTPRLALRCGRRFRQNAVVVGKLGRACRLLWCRAGQGKVTRGALA